MKKESSVCNHEYNWERTVTCSDLLYEIFRKKWIMLPFFLLCILAGLCVGYYQAKQSGGSEEAIEAKKEEIAVRLEEYDESIREMEENSEFFQLQIDRADQYRTDSIYMQIDPLYVKVVSNQYRITNDDNKEALNRLTAYIDKGSLKSDLAEAMGIYSEEYVSELISYATSNNILSITVIDVDPGRVQQMMDTMEVLLAAKCRQYGEGDSTRELVCLESTAYEEGRADIRNKQYEWYNSYNGYINTKANNDSKIESLRSDKTEYSENAEKELNALKDKVKIWNYGCYGAIVALVCMFGYALLRRYGDDMIQNERDVRALGFPVVGKISGKTKDASGQNSAVQELGWLLQLRDVHTLLVLTGSLSERQRERIESLLSALPDARIRTLMYADIAESQDAMQTAAKCDGCMIAAIRNRTYYKQLDHQLQICEALELPVIGSLYVE